MQRFGLIPWAFALLLTFLVGRVATKCTLNPPPLSDGIINDQQFQISWDNCTSPYLIQFWNRNSTSLLSTYNGTATAVYFTIENGVDYDVYFLLIDGAGVQVQSPDYIVKVCRGTSVSCISQITIVVYLNSPPPSVYFQPNPNEASISQASTSSLATINSIRSVSILSSASVQSVSSLSSESLLSLSSLVSLTSTSTTSPSSSFPSETSSSTTTSGAAKPSSGNTNVGPIVGGVVGGLLGLSVISLAIVWFLRHHRQGDSGEFIDPSVYPTTAMAQTGPPKNLFAEGSNFEDPTLSRNYHEGAHNYNTAGAGAGEGTYHYPPEGTLGLFPGQYAGSTQYGPTLSPYHPEERFGGSETTSTLIPRPLPGDSVYRGLPQV
ncbi:uncharacterized protein EI90DRAFT_1795333 [Cantharellus anzutake]|uniref:uncharacterized protein n=1 Tax=Cantharellus anzutake TaxID=1750568 RepID=UPI001906D2CB|nr:uncharacterized protein EI90DRAFT_1795333 [Cantharellus anzutake]KAF8327464.1 hypothetical protein EI90DRAFT_1795333 [Cantharellus anzutake]